MAERYSDTQSDERFQTVIAEGLAGHELGDLADVGDQEANVVLYEEVVLLLFPTGRYECVLVSLDRGSGVSLRDVVDLVDSTPLASE